MSKIFDKLPVEVSRLVVDHLGGEPSWARLSKVSWSWNEAANRVLWKNLDSFTPLLRLIPGCLRDGIWVGHITASLQKSSWFTDQSNQIVEKPITDKTLLRFDQIAAYVQHIDWSEAEWTQEDLKIFTALSCYLYDWRPNHDLLPNLRVFRIHCETDQSVKLVLPWISASLTEVDVNLGLAVDDEWSKGLMQALQRPSGSIRSFSLRMGNAALKRRVLTMGTLLRLIKGFRDVRIVAMPLYASPEKHIDALGAAPHLEELSLTLVEAPAGFDPITSSALFEGSENVYSVVDETLEGLTSLHGLPTASSQLSSGPQTATALPLHRFPSLHTLHITGTWVDIPGVMRATTHHLTQLKLTVPSLLDVETHNIMSFCRNLSFLSLDTS